LGKVISIPYGLLYKLEFQNRGKIPKEEYLRGVEAITANYNFDELMTNQILFDNDLVFTDIKKIYAQAYWKIASYLDSEYHDPKAAVDFVNKAFLLSSLEEP
jgi:hypothetical protein